MIDWVLSHGTAITIALAVIAIARSWWKSKQHYKNYWKKRGVQTSVQPQFFKTMKMIITMDFIGAFKKNYKEYGKVYGTFENGRPVISIADPNMLKDILVKDFHAFNSRRDMEFDDVIADNMVVHLSGEVWKRVRTIITPAFTTKRMKLISTAISDCTKSIIQACKKHSESEEAVDCKKLFGCFTMDVIARAAFGTKIDSASDPENEFVKNGRKIIVPPSIINMLMFLFAPKWLKKSFSFFSKEIMAFFRDVVLQVIKDRRKTGRRHEDLLQILMDANDGKLDKEEEFEDETDRFGSVTDSNAHAPAKYKKMSEDELLAQCVLFFFAGYETTASTLSYMAFCLATNPEWQERVIQEVDEAFQKHETMSYDAIRDLKILDAVMSETLRMYPILTVTDRVCRQDYKIGDTGISLEKGTLVVIPVISMHYDEEYFQDPEAFNPNRFLENHDPRSMQYVYLPFGAGPKNCLGMRLAQLEIKMVMASILKNFRFRLHATTKVPLEFKKGSALLSIDELPLVLSKRNDGL